MNMSTTNTGGYKPGDALKTKGTIQALRLAPTLSLPQALNWTELGRRLRLEFVGKYQGRNLEWAPLMVRVLGASVKGGYYLVNVGDVEPAEEA
jgi:hypothetical protein